MKHENKSQIQARNEALSSIYGEPKFKTLSYDNRTETFFGTVGTTKKKSLKKVNFYMPKIYAQSYLKNPEDASIEVHHKMQDNDLTLSSIDLKYKGIAYPMSLKSPTNMTLKIGGLFIADQNTVLYTKVNGLAGAVNLQELFNLESQTTAVKVDLSYAFNQRHKISFSYYSTKSTNTKYIEGINGSINGVSFDGGDVSLLFQTDLYKFNYIYSAYKTNHFEFNTRVGIHYTRFTTRLDVTKVVNGSSTTQTALDVSVPTPLPVLGLGFEYEITQDLVLKYYADYFLVTANIEGTLVDNQLQLEYMYNDYIGASIGLGRTTIDFNTKVDNQTFGLNHEISGFTGALLFKY